jgi:hypothetical protein
MIKYQVDTEIWLPFAAINGLDRTTGESGLSVAEITFRYGYADGTTGWTTKALDPADLKEKASGDGDYIIRLEVAENATKGVLMYGVTEAGAADFLPYKGAVQIVEHDPEEDIQRIVDRIGTPGAGGLTALLTALQTDMTLVKKLEHNNWIIDPDTDQMTFFDDDGSSVIAKFQLYDKNGLPNSVEPHERRRIS